MATIEVSPSPLMGAAERRVLAMLADGKPHSDAELRSIVYYPREWIKALREDGYVIEEQDGQFRLLTAGEHLA
jgi:biotin operon repressor